MLHPLYLKKDWLIASSLVLPTAPSMELLVVASTSFEETPSSLPIASTAPYFESFEP